MRNRINKFLVIVNAVILLVMFYSAAVIKAQTATAPAGNGTSSNPYQIATLNNLYWVTQNSSSWSKYFIQTADIDASNTKNWAGGAGFSPIGNSSTQFTGSYDGKGHTIDNLYINRQSTDYVGLFGYTSYGTSGNLIYGSIIDNLGLKNVSISGRSAVGGLAGQYTGRLDSCYSTGGVIGTSEVGGLVGYNYQGNIDFCNSAGAVTASQFDVGGLVGANQYSTVLRSYSTANVLGSDYVGGLVGSNNGSSSTNNATITNCYSIGSVLGTGTDYYIGGLLGQNSNGYVYTSFWDTQTSGQSSSAGGEAYGKTTAQMQTESTFTSAGWDFNSVWVINVAVNGGYPLLQWQGYTSLISVSPSGSGTSGDPYQIATLSNLYWLSQTTSAWAAGIYFIQTADIDASSTSGWDSGAGFSPIGNASTFFEGNYNGNGHTINGLYINRPSTAKLGLFGTISGTTVKNLGVTSVDINGGTDQIGGLLGVDRNSTISECYSTGNITSNGTSVGGIIGYNNSNCTVSNCYSSVYISGTGSAYVGGLVGINYSSGGTVSDCYAVSAVSSSATYTGGFCGSNLGTITGSFWDTDLMATGIGNGTTTGATGKTSSQMQTSSTYLNAGWDFSIWYRDNSYNGGFPYLAWQNPSGSPLPVGLSSFTATINENTVELKWETATELNNYGFNIERKTGTGDWTKVGFVAGSGNSNSPKSYSFTDQPTGGNTFSYRIKQMDNDGTFKYYDAITVNLNTKTQAELIGNYPNPFNPTTNIKFYIPATENVTIKIYDILGRVVTTLLNKQADAGYHIVYWNGRDAYGKQAASGMYIYRLQANGFVQTKKMLMLK